MGVKIKDLLERTTHTLNLNDLSKKDIAIDAMNVLYQFLSIIRQPDGKPLLDRQQRITSHLSGLFYRNINLLEENIRPIYVFDGKPPELKHETIIERKQIRETATEKWLDALDRGDLVEAKKFAQASSRFTEEMISDSKMLLSYIGLPYIQAPSEGEAQASYMVRKGDCWGAGSQDHDCLLFGADRLIRNLTITGRRKLPRKSTYIEVKPELINLEEMLKDLEITREQLIDIGILVGTDFNEGVKGIGPKTALKLIKEHEDLESIMKVKDVLVEVPIDQIRSIFLDPEVTDTYSIKWESPNHDKILEFLCEEHDFSQDRVKKGLERLEKSSAQKKQKTLFDWV
ncbi:flap endonuclease-1 [Candidatus Borrarchaeum sp.]|uniref:flap endonuclease-1 n=1 Tax=Candidatus Borrarchaeum sp. TaxID=2846742 RepID=UPI00257C8F3E|nr:flap endonuclease-1 [Candidatus Borrarchaeum sp.]